MVYKKLSESLFSIFDKSLVTGQKESLRIILKKIGVFVMWATCLKKLMKQVTLKGEKDQWRPKSSRTENNINAVKQLISSQEDKPGIHATPNEISKIMDISRTSIKRIIAEDLKLQHFKKIKGQRIDTRTKEKRIERCPNLLRVFTKQVLETAFFSNEKIFKVTQLLNVQNDRTYAPSA